MPQLNNSLNTNNISQIKLNKNQNNCQIPNNFNRLINQNNNQLNNLINQQLINNYYNISPSFIQRSDQQNNISELIKQIGLIQYLKNNKEINLQNMDIKNKQFYH